LNGNAFSAPFLDNLLYNRHTIYIGMLEVGFLGIAIFNGQLQHNNSPYCRTALTLDLLQLYLNLCVERGCIF
jgi:hypothetical protein